MEVLTILAPPPFSLSYVFLLSLVPFKARSSETALTHSFNHCLRNGIALIMDTQNKNVLCYALNAVAKVPKCCRAPVQERRKVFSQTAHALRSCEAHICFMSFYDYCKTVSTTLNAALQLAFSNVVWKS